MPSPVLQGHLPNFLRRLSTDEYTPRAYSARDRQVIAQAEDSVLRESEARRRVPGELALGRAGTAAGLRALNVEWGQTFYDVPPEAERDDETASASFDGPELVIDVQTHFMAPHCQNAFPNELLFDLYRGVMPTWWSEIDEAVKWDLATYISRVFLKTETGIAVLSSGPGLDDWRNLFNDELAATTALVTGMARSGRLLGHCVIHANVPGELQAMEEYRERFNPNGWKVYTMGVQTPEGPLNGWMLDDQDGLRFLERVRDSGVHLVCAHKGLSFFVDNGSPRDIGPAAKQFPEITFLVYHSGYEFPVYGTSPDAPGAPPEGPYNEASAHDGVNRLITSMHENGIGPGGNVYAELGTTWFSLIRRPVEAAHVLGKFLTHIGEDNILWGTDSIWYGSAQPLIDAFRSFQIPDSMCEEFGYPALTPTIKEKILSLNAARVYEIDLPAMRAQVANDDLTWARQIIEDYRQKGFAGLR